MYIIFFIEFPVLLWSMPYYLFNWLGMPNHQVKYYICYYLSLENEVFAQCLCVCVIGDRF